MNKQIVQIIILTFLLISISGSTFSSEITVNTSVDIYNRYVWRGMDIANTPSMQPSLSIGYGNFEIGTWGAYTLSNYNSEYDEIDFWLGYTFGFESGASVSLVATDYYFPNAGIKFFNFNNYDAVDEFDEPDPGAHTIELGVTVTLPETFPLTISGYMNVYNEEGNNTYFQVDYPLTSGDTQLDLFFGATGGSKDNPSYYGADSFTALNYGITASKEIKMSESFSLPLTVSFVINPNDEIAHLLVGVTF